MTHLQDRDSVRKCLGRLQYCRTMLGSLPAQPGSARGYVGMFLVRSVRRMLFWFIPQVDSFFAASIEMGQLQLGMLESIANANERAEALTLSYMEQLRGMQSELDNWHRGSGNASTVVEEGPEVVNEIREMRAAFEQHQAQTEALLWMQSVKWRALIEELKCIQADGSHLDGLR